MGKMTANECKNVRKFPWCDYTKMSAKKSEFLNSEELIEISMSSLTNN